MLDRIDSQNVVGCSERSPCVEEISKERQVLCECNRAKTMDMREKLVRSVGRRTLKIYGTRILGKKGTCEELREFDRKNDGLLKSLLGTFQTSNILPFDIRLLADDSGIES